MLEKKLLLSCIILFAAATVFLFWQNDRQLDPQNGKDFWNLSFAVPERPESLDFTIENQSDDTNFDYIVTENRRVIEKNSVQVQSSRKATVKPLATAVPGTLSTITVTHGKDTKEIYRK